MNELKPCPFCGEQPLCGPINPEEEGNAWGYVKCTNLDCHAQPVVSDGEKICDERGSEVYKQLAIKRWNTRTDEARVKALEGAVHEIIEIYTGMDGFKPKTAPEAYQQRIIKQMYETARNAK